MQHSVMPESNPAHPNMTSRSRHRRFWQRPLMVLLTLLLLVVVLHFIAATHTAYPTIPLRTCTNLIRNTDYTKFIQLRSPTQELNAVQFVDQLVGGAPAALVPISAPDGKLDIYIYGCKLQEQVPQLTLLFKQQDLAHGTVSVSRAHTLLVTTRDTTLSPSASMQIEPWRQDIAYEYTWRSGRFVPVIFPALYPVLTRAEAETLQEQFNAGQMLPWNDPLATARQLVRDLFRWPEREIQSRLLDSNTTQTHVSLSRKNLHTNLSLTLARLIDTTTSGLWFVTAAQSPDLTLETQHLRAPISSPTLLHGVLRAPLGTTSVALFNHLLTPIQVLNRPRLTLLPKGLFSGLLLYDNPLAQQPALLLLENQRKGKRTVTTQLFLTSVILS